MRLFNNSILLKLFAALASTLTIGAVISPANAASSIELKDFSCTQGAFRLLIPRTYAGLIKLGRVRTFADGNVPDAQGANVRHRLIEFDGMSLWIVRRSDLAEGYRVSYAVITSPRWKLLPFRVGQPAPAVAAAWPEGGQIPRDGAWQIEGETDLLKLQMKNGLVQSLTLDCATD